MYEEKYAEQTAGDGLKPKASKFSIQAEKVEKVRRGLAEAIMLIEVQFKPVLSNQKESPLEQNTDAIPADCEFDEFINSTCEFIHNATEQLNSISSRACV